MPAGRFQDNPAYASEVIRARAAIRRSIEREHAQDLATQTLRDSLIAEKRCIRCGLHCPKRYDVMRSHLCGDCFWNE